MSYLSDLGRGNLHGKRPGKMSGDNVHGEMCLAPLANRKAKER